MNRRMFFKGLGALIGGIAIDQAIPFGRVWSFPKEIRCLNAVEPVAMTSSLAHYATVYYDRAALKRLENCFNFVRYSEYQVMIHSGELT